MGDSRDSNKQLPLASLFTIFAALSVIFFSKLPFKESRPDISEVPEYSQKVPARLWQDPFQAVLDGYDGSTDSIEPFFLCSEDEIPEGKLPTTACRTESGNPPQLHKAIRKKLGEEENVTILGVMVVGAPYAEEREVRIRSRYATVSALSRLGFAPDDAEHVGYVQLLRSSEPPKPRKTLSMADVMPYEWFRSGKNSILLLWLNDEVFKEDGHPLRNITYLSINLRQNQDKPVPLKIVGPAGGGTLRRMVREVRDLTAPEGGAVVGAYKVEQPWIEIYSGRATVDDLTLIDVLPEKEFVRDPAQCLRERFRKAGFFFERTICSDREIANKIISELKNRGIDCRDGRNHIALISESDTYYGRSLATRYRSVFLQNAVFDPAHQVHSFSYIRGIDGKLPQRPGSGGASRSEKGSLPSKADMAVELERASGLSQFDYVRRLAEEIYGFEQNLAKGGKIRAIGILGSDFHDKYLVLQALRQRFPQTVFFTTDLDARMLHPDSLPSTRNLLVASSFDLNLRSDAQIDLQGGSPPFRDSYQTSIFYTILKSFRDSAAFDPEERHALGTEPVPKIFEIGRTRAVDLSEDPASQGGFDPQPREAANSLRIVSKLVGILLLLILLLSLSSDAVRALLQSQFLEKNHAFAVIAFFMLLVLSAFLFGRFILLAPHQEEPFSFMEGVSVWPTEMLRLTAVILSFFFIWRGSVDIGKNNRQIARRFRLWRRQRPSRAKGEAEPMGELLWNSGKVEPSRMGAVPEAPLDRKSRTGIVSDIRAMFRSFADVTTYAWRVDGAKGDRRSRKWSGAPVQIDDYWGEYLLRDSMKYRVRRLAPIVASYFALCLLIISFGRPEPPVRGVLSMAIDMVVLIESVVAMVTIIFYAFDVIKTCRRFTELLAERAPTWSETSYMKMMGERSHGAKEPMSEWMLVELIASRTEVVGKLIFYPFIICLIIFIARLNYFDNWRTPLGLLVVICIAAAYAWSCAVVLRMAAEGSRKAALDRLLDQQAAAVAEGDEKRLQRISFAFEAIKSIKSGAFSPLSQNPVVQALMVPFGGIGGVYVLEFLGKLKM